MAPRTSRTWGSSKINLGRVFIPCPIAHTQGWTVEQRPALIAEAVKLTRLLHLPVKVGVISGARPGEVGSRPYLSETFADALDNLRGQPGLSVQARKGCG